MSIEFHYNQLDPVGFQRLVNAILTARFGEPIRLFPLRGTDGGRDAELPESGVFELNSRQIPFRASQKMSGPALFQVKHHRTLDGPLHTARGAVISDFNDELTQNVLPRLSEAAIKSFFLVTNVPASKDAYDKVDQKRKELLKGIDLYADVLWSEHLTAWLDQYPQIWTSFPDLFAGRMVPRIASLASDTSEGVLRSFRLAFKTQLARDETVRFRQVDLEQKLTNLFVDLKGIPIGIEPDQLHQFTELIGHREIQAQDADLPEEAFYSRHFRNEFNCMALLTSEGSSKESGTNFRKFLLEGGPGQGKSTLSQMLAQVYRALLLNKSSNYSTFCLPAHARLPFRIELRSFSEWMNSGGDSIEQFIVHSLSKDSGGTTITVEDWQKLVEGESIVLILDGLDEVGGDDSIDAVLNKIAECIHRLESLDANAKIVLTTRPPAIAGKAARLPGFTNIRILPLDSGQVKQYVQKWTTCIIRESEDRERVTQSFDKRRNEVHVKALATNPMQLSVLLHFIRMSGEAFPDKRAELYRDYFKIVIDRDVEKTPRLRTMRREIEALHELLGFKIHSSAESENAGGSASIGRPELIAFVKDWLLEEKRNASIDADDLFRLGEDRLGLIVALKGEGGKTSYGFEVQPVREYFAASYINQRAPVNANEFFAEMIRRPFWREVGLFLAGLRRDNERADLLLRAKALDSDDELAWRQDGRATVLELLQEGVLASPGHVQWDSLSFVFELIDPKSVAPRNEPDRLMEALAPLALACGARAHTDQLERYLTDGKRISDVGAMRRLHQSAGKVLDREKFSAYLRGFPGDSTELSALIHIAWPDSNKIDLIELSEGSFWPELPTHKWASVWFKAVAASTNKAALKANCDYHLLLLEQFSFSSFIHFFALRQHPLFSQQSGLQPLNSSWGVWCLCGSLQKLCLLMMDGKNTALQLSLYNTEIDLSGLPPRLAETLQELIQLAQQGLESLLSSKDTEKLERVLIRLADQFQAEGLSGWLACRFALTLLEAMDDSRRYVIEELVGADEAVRYLSRRLPPPSRIQSRFSRLENWKMLRMQLEPFYQGAYWLGKGKKFNPNRVISQGLASVPPSQVNVGGLFVPVMDLLASQLRGDENGIGDDVKSLISHVPIPRSWFRSLLERKDIPLEPLLIRIAENHTLSGPLRPLTASSMQRLCALARRSSSPDVLSGILTVLLDSNFWAFIDDDTLGRLIEADGKQADVAWSLFRDMGSRPRENPRLLSLAKLIVAGKTVVSRSTGVAAARYSAKNISLKLEPLGVIFEKRRGEKQIY